MPEALLAIEGPDGSYREIEAEGYAPAPLNPMLGGLAVFPQAGANWGMVRACALRGSPWVPLAVPAFVRVGDIATLDTVAARLHIKTPTIATDGAVGSAWTGAIKGEWGG